MAAHLPEVLPQTAPLELTGDLARWLVDGLHRYLDRATATAASQRDLRPASPPAQQRAELAKLLGTATPLAASRLRVDQRLLWAGDAVEVRAARWEVYRGVEADGLLLTPPTAPRATVVLLGDCATAPEEWLAGPLGETAGGLAASGCQVLLPRLVSRAIDHAGWPGRRAFAISSREFIYRAAFELGRHLIGFEIDTVRAALGACGSGLPAGLWGQGEGGLLALWTAALDERVQATVVAGAFEPRETLWQQPIDRNVWRLLTAWGDAEVAALVAPRTLLLVAAEYPTLTGPVPSDTTQGHTPGDLRPPPAAAVAAEFSRLQQRWSAGPEPRLLAAVAAAQEPFAAALGLAWQAAPPLVAEVAPQPADELQQRLVDTWIEHTQRLVRAARDEREQFWAAADPSSVATWETSTAGYRERFHRDLIGRLPDEPGPLSPRSRLVRETAECRIWQVVLEVAPDVAAYGMLVLPRDLQPGERRPVVVCQHGLEGRCENGAYPDPADAYHAWGHRLAAEEGYVVFAPQNPYLFYDHFRTLQRQANPLGLSLFSFIIAQHDAILRWLAEQPFVVPEKIAFYGISYGGKTAMRVPAVLTQYCLSICSADFNEWLRKCAAVDQPGSYLYTREWEMFEFDLGPTFNYAEMAWLICPRPFMVERGHHDGVGLDEWVGHEWGRAYRRWSLLKLGGRASIEWTDGPHAIFLQGTRAFLRQWLGPAR
ncbi:MAG: hypothetical protein IT204_13240 [Fimbriimonadaceae bacterium]|nr:hypothetical protein [Fimbriimonadaceae bacterium]